MNLSKVFQIPKNELGIPKIFVGILVVLFGLGIFTVGFDQGQLLSLAFGSKAFDDMYMHELFHDIRHAAGYPCH